MNTKLWILFCLLSIKVFSQTTISGKVENEFGETIDNGYVVQHKDSISKSVIFYTLIRNGTFFMELKSNNNKPIFIEVISEGYQSQKKKISIPYKTPIIFTLVKDDNLFLDEVIVKERPKFSMKKDTISFVVDAYKTLEDRKVEDVIKRLPGVTVDENTGSIYYNGVSIENITIDGDDLFRYNYTIATKNINLKVIDEIEVVENYSRNKLLKGIENSNNISVNLKLKKNVTDYTGSLETNLGFFDDISLAHANNLNLMTINSSFKSFGNISKNNIGINNSPFSGVQNAFSTEAKNEKNIFLEPLIQESGFNSIIDNDRTNINSNYFISFNSLYKVNKNVSINTSIYDLGDEIRNNQLLLNQFEINDSEFTTTDLTNFKNKPRFRRIDQEYNFNLNKSSTLEYVYRIQQSQFNSNNTIIQNQEEQFSSTQNSKNLYIKQSLNFTKRLDSLSALKINSNYFYTNDNQNFNLSSFDIDDTFSNQSQEVSRQNNFYNLEADYLKKIGSDNLSMKVFSFIDITNFNSNFLPNTNQVIQNDFIYKKQAVGLLPSYSFKNGKSEINTSISLSLNSLNLEDKIEFFSNSNTAFFLQPNISYIRNLTSKSSLITSVSHKRNSIPVNYLFSNPILIDNRTIISNTPSLDFIKNNNLNLLYSYNDLFENFQFSSNLNYGIQTGNFLSVFDIDENSVNLIYFFEPIDFSTLNFTSQISKFVSPINSTIKYRFGINSNSFKNIVNDSEIRNSSISTISNHIFYKSAFSFFLNFENEATLFTNRSSSNLGSTFVNNSFINKFKIFSKISSQLRASLSVDIYVPDASILEQNFNFWDFNFLVKSKNKKWEYGLRMKNIFNTKNFVQIQNNDFSTSIFTSNILPMHSLGFVNFDF